MPEYVITELLSHGPLATVCGILLWALWQKDKDLSAERAARIADAKGYTTMALELQSKVIDAVHRLTDVFDELRKRGP